MLSSRTWRLVQNTALLKLVFVLANLSALYLPGSVCLGLFFTVSFSTLGLAWLSQHPRETCLFSMAVCQAVPACFLLLHFNMTSRGRHYTLPLLTALFSKTGLRNSRLSVLFKVERRVGAKLRSDFIQVSVASPQLHAMVLLSSRKLGSHMLIFCSQAREKLKALLSLTVHFLFEYL